MLGDIKLPQRVQEAMQMQVEAERKKRAAILESEGIREAEVNVAEGKRLARILASGTVLLTFSMILNNMSSRKFYTFFYNYNLKKIYVYFCMNIYW